MQVNQDVQKVVVDVRTKEGYEQLGFVQSTTCGGKSVLLVKGKHILVINALGFDEHTFGRTYKIFGSDF